MFELAAERTPDRTDLIRTRGRRALSVLIPRNALVGIAMLSLMMVWAMLARIFFRDSAGSAVVFPAIILGLLIGIGIRART